MEVTMVSTTVRLPAIGAVHETHIEKGTLEAWRNAPATKSEILTI